MSRVLFVDILAEANADDCENIGQATLAAVLRAQGHVVTLMSLSIRESATCDVDALAAADIVGFSIYNNSADAVFALASRLGAARPAVFLCAGGQLASAVPRALLKACAALDACLTGNAEVACLALADGAPAESVTGIVTRAAPPAPQPPRVKAPDTPWPVRDLLALSIRKGNPTARLNTSLGCVADCGFCSVNGFWTNGGERLRQARWSGRPPQDVYEEIRAINEATGVRSFVFNDASFEDPGRIGLRRVLALCDLMGNLPAPVALRCAMRAETLDRHGEMLLPAMRVAGFTNVFIGVEADSDADLDRHAKLADARQNRRALAVAARHDIDVTIGFIMFHSRSTPDSLRRNAGWLVDYGADKADHYLRMVDVYAGTPLEAELREAGLLMPDYDFRRVHAWRFVDRDVASLSAALAPLRQGSVLNRIDGQIYHLGYTISALRALFSEAAEEQRHRFADLRGRYAALLADHFAPLFEQMTPPPLGWQAPLLEAAEALRVELSGFGTGLMLRRDFAGFFRPKSPAPAPCVKAARNQEERVSASP